MGSKTCPQCGSNEVGIIGNKQYFCSNCCIEYDLSSNSIFEINEDGTITEMSE